MRERIAIVGGGIAGLSAGWMLSGRHEVTLFERNRRLGGNAYTIDTRDGDAADIAVAAFGRAGYRNFYRLLDRLGVGTSISPGSFVSLHDLDTGRGFYVTLSPRGLLAQRFDLLRPSRLRALLRLDAGLRRLRRLFVDGRLHGATLEEALERIPQLTGLARRLFLCVLCLLSSMEADEVLAAPAAFFAGKLLAHPDVLSPRAFASIRCVPGGTRRYVQALARAFGGRIVLGARIRTIRRDESGVELVFHGGARRRFERLVLACNADAALGLLEEPTERERELLGPWRYKEGRIVVHHDHTSFPPRPLQQAFTFLYTEREGRLATSVNGCLRSLPGVRGSCDTIGSQHPNFPIRPDRVELETVLRTPIFDFASCRTIPHLPSLNGVRRTYHCGSHFGFGLHEDAVSSAVAVARALGVELDGFASSA